MQMKPSQSNIKKYNGNQRTDLIFITVKPEPFENSEFILAKAKYSKKQKEF